MKPFIRGWIAKELGLALYPLGKLNEFFNFLICSLNAKLRIKQVTTGVTKIIHREEFFFQKASLFLLNEDHRVGSFNQEETGDKY